MKRNQVFVLILFLFLLTSCILALWNLHRWGNARAVRIEGIARGLKTIAKDLDTVLTEVSDNRTLTHRGEGYLWGIHRTNAQLRDSLQLLQMAPGSEKESWDNMNSALSAIELYLEDFYSSPLTSQDENIVETLILNLNQMAGFLDSLEEGLGFFGKRYFIRKPLIRETNSHSTDIILALDGDRINGE